MSEIYSNFAAVYDTLMDNIPYDDWAEYLHGLLLAYDIRNGILAELGCGTGNITERMAVRGYDMIGIDNSPDMLEIANQKRTTNQSSSLYLLQDMREFELYGTVSAVISLCDSINYITDSEDLVQVFRLVNNYLDPGGLFIFDFHTASYYRDVVANATIAEDRGDISFIWDNYYDEKTAINELSLSLFVRDDTYPEPDLFRRCEEFHVQKGYTLQEMQQLVECAGLTTLACYDAFTQNPATEDCERIYMIARETRNADSSKRYIE